jgi:hypothetical protein
MDGRRTGALRSCSGEGSRTRSSRLRSGSVAVPASRAGPDHRPLPGNLVSSGDKNVEGRLDDATDFQAISWMSVQRNRLRVLVQLSIELDLPSASLGREDLGKCGYAKWGELGNAN